MNINNNPPESDSHLEFRALTYWANYIETGNIITSADDLERIGRSSEKNELSNSQLAFVARLRQLANKKFA